MVSIEKCALFGFCLRSEGVDFFGSVRVGVGHSFVDKDLCPLFIVVKSLCLKVRAVLAYVAGRSRSLVAVKTEPVECLKNKICRTFDVTGLIGVFNTEDKCAALLTS